MEIRIANIEDVNVLCETRKKQLKDEGFSETRNIDDELHEFFTRRISDGSLYQVILENEGKLISTGGIIYYDFPPSFTNLTGLRGYVANIYTIPKERGKGYASKVITALLEDAKKRKVKKIWLAASKMGRPVYEKIGFHESDEMMELWLNVGGE